MLSFDWLIAPISADTFFKDYYETELTKLGIKVVWVDNWELYHTNLGEVHCGTNSLRAVPDTQKWWESGR